MNTKRKLLYILISIVILAVWAHGYYYGQYVRCNFNSVSVRMHSSDMLTKQDILIALENEKIKGTEDTPVITAWKQADGQKLEYEELATAANLSVIEFWGDVTQVMPIKLVRGSIMTKEDETGCMIDENTAYRLFRTNDAVGRRLTYQGKSYCIRGVIKAREEVLIIPVTDDKNSYSNLEFVYSSKESGKKNVSDFMEENGLADDYTIVEGCFYAQLLQLASGLPLWLLGLFLLYQFVITGKKFRVWFSQRINQRKYNTKKRKKSMMCPEIKNLLEKTGLFFIFAITVLLFTRLMSGFIFPIPERYIPTRWSDFSFWIKLVKEMRKQLAALEYLAPATKDILLFHAVKRCVVSSLITSALTVIFMTRIRADAKYSAVCGMIDMR